MRNSTSHPRCLCTTCYTTVIEQTDRYKQKNELSSSMTGDLRSQSTANSHFLPRFPRRNVGGSCDFLSCRAVTMIVADDARAARVRACVRTYGRA